MDELKAGIEPVLTVLPKPAVLLQPGKAALHNPALGHDLEGMQLTALGYLYCDVFAQRLTYALCEGLARVATVAQHALHSGQPGLAALERLQRSFAIRHFGRRDCRRVWESLAVYRYVALDARDLFACVVAFQARRVRVLHALRVPRSIALAVRCAPVSRGPRQPDFFKACSSRLTPSWSGSLHLEKYE